MKVKKKTIVVHSGGMDSSLCLALAVQEFGCENVLSMSFSYGQTHSLELKRAKKICQDWKIDHICLNIECLSSITENALVNRNIEISHPSGASPNTLVVGRNGLMARLAAIHAESLGADSIYMGVIEIEAANAGYRDCNRFYMDLLQKILRMDLNNSKFEIRTPIISLTKCETLELGHRLGILEYLLKETITCYRSIPEWGCDNCPSCKLRNEGIREYMSKYTSFKLPY